MKSLITGFWSAVNSVFGEIGGLVLFTREVLVSGVRSSFSKDEVGFLDRILEQVWTLVARSLATVGFSGAFVGAILVLQFTDILKTYDATVLLGGLNSSAIIREVGPLLISFILAGKVGAFTAAELGTMRVTEQIDAIECLGTNPMSFLIVPRFLGIIAASLILLLLGLMTSVIGSAFLAEALCGVGFSTYLGSIPRFVTFSTFFGGFLKSLLFGIVVASVCCYKGYTTKGGAQGVGRSVTQAAVLTILLIVVMDFLSSGLITWFEEIVLHA